ncbi:cellulose binding domain-containing protein [Actinocorallia aurantiaca]|uniref:CBM2 domain-containing protein n=1 Tax=Actinocorallia aurantiaca TaxID=46204 RepID=A0ABN3U7Q6_9ACTN
MDAEEERSAGSARRDDEEGWATAPLVLSPRPLPDVVFGSVKPAPAEPREPAAVPPEAGPEEVTGPQAVVGAPPAAERRQGRKALLLVAVVLAGALAVTLVAAALWSSDSEGRVPQAAPDASTSAAVPGDGTPEPGQRAEEGSPPEQWPPAAADDPAEPAAVTAPPVSGTTAQGVEVTYRTVEVSDGYFEGEVTLTNGTGAELKDWTLSFTYPGASIRNVWAGHLWTRDDGTVVVTGDENTASIPEGASATVRFGGSGTPSGPQGCTLNGSACGL